MSSATAQRQYKTRSEALGWLFGDPMDNFDSLIPAMTPASSEDYSFCPTKQNVIQHWIACMDKTRNSFIYDKNAIIWEVVDNLISFWNNNTTGIELR